MDIFEGTGGKEPHFNPIPHYYYDQDHQEEGDDAIATQSQEESDSKNIVKSSFSTVKESSAKFTAKTLLQQDSPAFLGRRWLSSKDEGILDRFKRLEWEVKELEKDILLTEQADEEILLDGTHIAEKIKGLTSRISSLNKRALESPLEKIGSPSDNLSMLKSDLAKFKSAKIGGLVSNQNTPNSTNEGRLVYELSIDDRVLNAPANDEKTFELEQRITNLERVIGIHALDPATSVVGQESSSLFATSGTLIGALERIDHQLAILADPLVFDQAMRRVKEASAALDKLAELKRKQKLDQRIGATKKTDLGEIGSGIAAATPIDSKIIYLYNQMMKLDAVGNIIPHLISRLLSLKELHSEAATFAESLAVLQEDQQSLLQLGADTQKGLEILAKTMSENQEKTIGNITALMNKK